MSRGYGLGTVCDRLSHDCTELEVADQGQMEWKAGAVWDFSILVVITLLTSLQFGPGGRTQLVCRMSSCQGTLRSTHPRSCFLQEQR